MAQFPQLHVPTPFSKGAFFIFFWPINPSHTLPSPACAFPSLQKSNDGRAFTVFISFKTNMWHSAVPAETFDGSELRSALRAALERSCMAHYKIGQGTRKWEDEN